MRIAGRELGLVGLGRLGSALAVRGRAQGLRVVGLSKCTVAPEVYDAGVGVVDAFPALVAALERPRVLLLVVPAGPAVDEVIDAVLPSLGAGDVIADAGHSYWGDSIRRAERLRERGVDFVDVGTSGVRLDADGDARRADWRDAVFTLGGRESAVAAVEPILRTLASPSGCVHVGDSGAGHFARLVHGGVELAMLQALGEGVDLLERFHARLDVPALLNAWAGASSLRSHLGEALARTYAERGGLGDAPAYLEDTGEGQWLVGDALAMEAAIPVLTQSVLQMLATRDRDKRGVRATAMARQALTGRRCGEDPFAAMERRMARVGGAYQPTSPAARSPEAN
jgi:6-phosphogluconate dehydrogenase